MMATLFAIFGVVGAACCISMFFALERGMLPANSRWFYGINGFGAFLVFIGSGYDFDRGDSGTLIQEGCWMAVSLMGFIKNRKRASDAAN